MILARRARGRGFRASPTWLAHIAESLMRERHPDLADFEGGREWRRRFLARHRLTWCANVDQTDDHKVPPNNLFVGPVLHKVEGYAQGAAQQDRSTAACRPRGGRHRQALLHGEAARRTKLLRLRSEVRVSPVLLSPVATIRACGKRGAGVPAAFQGGGTREWRGCNCYFLSTSSPAHAPFLARPQKIHM